MFKNILLGVDGSEHALRAAKIAGELARQMDSDLWVVACFDPVPAYLGEPNLQQALNLRLQQGEEVLAPALEEIGKIPGFSKQVSLVLFGRSPDHFFFLQNPRLLVLRIFGKGILRIQNTAAGVDGEDRRAMRQKTRQRFPGDMLQKEVEFLLLFDERRQAQESGFYALKVPNRFSLRPVFSLCSLSDNLAPDHIFETPPEKFPLPGSPGRCQ